MYMTEREHHTGATHLAPFALLSLSAVESLELLLGAVVGLGLGVLQLEVGAEGGGGPARSARGRRQRAGAHSLLTLHPPALQRPHAGSTVAVRRDSCTKWKDRDNYSTQQYDNIY